MPTQSGLLTKAELTEIQKVLYEPAGNKQELSARKILQVNTGYNPYAKTIGYEWYDRKGSARIVRAGSRLSSLELAQIALGRATQPAFDILTAYDYSEDEINEYRNRAMLAGQQSIAIDRLKALACRRFVAEGENKLVFTGDSDLGVEGLLNASGISKTTAPEGATGATAAAKRLWSNKTAKEKLNDIIKLRAVLQADAIFEAKVLCLPPAQYDALIEPYSDTAPISLMEWMRSQGAALPRVEKVKELTAGLNGDTVDYMMMLDNDIQNMEIALPQDLMMGEDKELPDNGLYKAYQVNVGERCAGAVIRHRAAVAIYTGI